MSDEKVLQEVGGPEVVEAGAQQTVGVEAGGGRGLPSLAGGAGRPHLAPGVVHYRRAGAAAGAAGGAGGPVGAGVLEYQVISHLE